MIETKNKEQRKICLVFIFFFFHFPKLITENPPSFLNPARESACVRTRVTLPLFCCAALFRIQNKRFSQKSPNERIIKIHYLARAMKKKASFFFFFFFEFLCVAAIFLDFSKINCQPSSVNDERFSYERTFFGVRDKKRDTQKNVVVTLVQNNNDDAEANCLRKECCDHSLRRWSCLPVLRACLRKKQRKVER